jgi:hypothetical protein
MRARAQHVQDAVQGLAQLRGYDSGGYQAWGVRSRHVGLPFRGIIAHHR